MPEEVVVVPRCARPIDGGSDPGLELVRRLCQTLSTEGVDYCHWKSNDHLRAALAGETDLDLLVDGERLDDGTYGYCEETGEPISLKRLEARPIATLSLEAQERHERNERVFRDD